MLGHVKPLTLGLSPRVYLACASNCKDRMQWRVHRVTDETKRSTRLLGGLQVARFSKLDANKKLFNKENAQTKGLEPGLAALKWFSRFKKLVRPRRRHNAADCSECVRKTLTDRRE